MEKVRIDSGWRMRSLEEKEFVTAKVPGSVYQAYLDNGKMEDPYYRDNELKALKLMEQDFEYVTEFEVPENVINREEVILRFAGIDTLGEIWLNGHFLGKTDNMHRIWEYRVKALLQEEKKNELRVVLHSPVKYLRERYEKDPKIMIVDEGIRGASYLRKAHCMFGWDWGPRLPDAGIFREVSLLGVDSARFDNVYVIQKHEAGKVELSISAEAEVLGEERLYRYSADGTGAGEVYRYVEEHGKDGENPYRLDHPASLHREKTDTEALQEKGYEVSVCVYDPDGKCVAQGDALERLKIEEPRLWWPSGYGEQPLYTVKAVLRKDGAVLDVWEKRIGLRTMTMAREEDEWGECFCHEVNGVKIFAMGADYIPEDNILPRVNKERTRHLLEQAKAAHFNSIRVWGGGYYPSDDFYDCCDELGLVVWQDFMFACAVYDLTPEFEANIRAEFADNVKRLRHHASLGLWCGNNEMEQFLVGDGVKYWCKKQSQIADYFTMYHHVIPGMLRVLDPQTFYWPSSPSSGGRADDANDETCGDVHYWAVWHGNKPITEFRKFHFRYLSEFGFQSFPGIETVKTFTEPEDRNIFSYVMETHQRNSSANGKIMNYMEQTFKYPTNFETLLYASQLLQAEAMRYGVEHFRRIRGCCMGTVIWQLNDCWPVASWAMIDYEGRWKAVQYYAKRFFAPLMISCAEEGVLSQNPNVNAEPYEVKKSIHLCVCNETMENRIVQVRWQLRNAEGTVLKEEGEEISVQALSSQWLEKEEMPQARLREDYVYYELKENGQVISSGTVLFGVPKYFNFRDPKLKAERISADEIQVTSEAYARSVEILNGDDTMLLEDNYFDMNPGTRILRVVKGEPENLKVRSVYDIR